MDLFLEVLSSPVDPTEIANIKLSHPQLATAHQEGIRERVTQVDIVNRQAEVFNENPQAASVTSDVSGRKPGCGLSFVVIKATKAIQQNTYPDNSLSWITQHLYQNYLHFLTGLLCDSCPSNQVTNGSSEICG